MNGIDILINVMYTAVVIVSILLICLVLVQPSKSGGMGAAFGGLGQSVFGAQAGSHLTKLTVVLTSVFFVLALTLAFLIGHRAQQDALSSELSRLAGAEAAVSAAVPGDVAAASAPAADDRDAEGSKAAGN